MRQPPRWQLGTAHWPADDAVRMLDLLGPGEVQENRGTPKDKLTPKDIEELAATHAIRPFWLAGPVRPTVAGRIKQTT